MWRGTGRTPTFGLRKQAALLAFLNSSTLTPPRSHPELNPDGTRSMNTPRLSTHENLQIPYNPEPSTGANSAAAACASTRTAPSSWSRVCRALVVMRSVGGGGNFSDGV